MVFNFKTFFASLVFIVVVDYIWLFVIMSGFYKNQLGSLLRGGSSSALPVVSALVVWILIVLGLMVLVLPLSSTLMQGIQYGALFGLVVYGVYNFTNYAIIARYTIPVVVADTLWGCVVCAATSAVIFLLNQRF